MKHLEQLIRAGTPQAGRLFRPQSYGKNGLRQFLRDVCALANADTDGPRYLVVGVEVNGRRRRYRDVPAADFRGKPDYAAAVTDYLEPLIELSYSPVEVDGHRLGVYEIRDSRDRPYMLRIDYSDTLRRGDAYQHTGENTLKLGRRQLQTLFEARFRDAVAPGDVELGFPGESIGRSRRIPLGDFDQLPSAVAGEKLRELLKVKKKQRAQGATSRMARLTHARLFGSDDPYEDRSATQIISDLERIDAEYRDADAHYCFDAQAEKLQLVVYNQAEETLRDVSVSLIMPNDPAFLIARELPPQVRDERFVPPPPAAQADYPAVRMHRKAIDVAARPGDIAAGACVELFREPLRLFAGTELKGRRFAISWTLFAANLRVPVKGRLRLLF